ncbi:hypothetical protein [Aquabacterium sp.]|uniref:hypothetical protein n=1 Tax=Aquabacterium sp. TaxID=1872578 RepID=UPI00198BA229|nr:hypothetical protein [Aquabacterium sp.]MBC7700861.1 hypothetical protein [Aquabacterium sp.]
MFRLFLLTLLSSWVVNPLGIAVAHHFGVANTSTVVLLLLGAGACGPFQLFMNECLAAGAERRQFQATSAQLALVLVIQSLAYGLSVAKLSSLNFHMLEIIVLGVFLAVSTLLSYRISMVYYGLVIRRLVSTSMAILIGAIPGLISLAVYLGYCLSHRLLPNLSSEFLLLVSILPALAQWAIVKAMAQDAPANIEIERPTLDTPRVANFALITMIGTLAMLTMAGSVLRESIAIRSLNHVALVLVGLNSLVSLANMVTRSQFLSRARDARPFALKGAIVGCALLALVLWAFNVTFALFAALASTQLCIVAAVEFGRTLRTVPAVQLSSDQPPHSRTSP